MRVVTAFTPGPYAALADKLLASCHRFSVPVFPVPFSDKGSWAANCNYKPTAILQAMQQTGDDVLWLDADMELIAPLPGFAKPADCWLHRPQAYGQVFDFTRGAWVNNTAGLRAPWGGHCAFANTPITLRMLATWQGVCTDWTPDTNDEQCLLESLAGYPALTIALFPPTASWLRHTPAGQQHGKPEAWKLV
jgi:hypothetical protein